MLYLSKLAQKLDESLSKETRKSLTEWIGNKRKKNNMNGGAFFCPYCKTQNACSCETCRPHIKQGQYINQWTDDGEALICGKCAATYSPDQSLDEEFKQSKNQ